MKNIFRKLIAVTLVTMVLIIPVMGTTVLASEWDNIDFDDVPSGTFDGTDYTSQWGVTFSHDSEYMPSQGPVTAIAVDTISDSKGLGLINDEAGLHLNIFTEGDNLVSNGAIRATFSDIYTGGPSPKNEVWFYIGKTNSLSDEYVCVKAYDVNNNVVAEASIAKPTSPASVVLSTRRNDIDSVVIYSNAPFWIDGFVYDYAGVEDPFAILDSDAYTGTVGSPIIFDASASYQRDGEEMTFNWSFDGGTTWVYTSDGNADPIYQNTWDSPWEGTVTLKVLAGDERREDFTTATVTVTNPPDLDFKSHGQYVKSVAQYTESGPGKGAIVSEAAKSDTGKKQK